MTIVMPTATIRTLALLIARSRRLVLDKNDGATMVTKTTSTTYDNATDSSRFIFECTGLPALLSFGRSDSLEGAIVKRGLLTALQSYFFNVPGENHLMTK